MGYHISADNAASFRNGEFGIYRAFCSGDEGVAKPDPAAYWMTLARLGVKPGEAVFIDDTRENVESARSLGIRSVLFTHYAALVVELKELIDSTLLEK